IEKLEETRRELSTYVDAHKALISPIRRMPPDILSEIFIACLPTHRNCVMSATEPPVLLGRVCSSWRALSMETPRLWSSLHVVEVNQQFKGYGDISDKLTLRVETMKMWLMRSGQCPLSISLQGQFYRSPNYTPPLTTAIADEPVRDEENPINLFLAELIQFASRWRRVGFVLTSDALHALGHLTVEDVPLLEDFSVSVTDRVGLVPTDGPSDFRWADLELLKSPLLTRFSGSGRDFDNLRPIPLRWGVLRELSIGGPAWESGLDDERMLELLSMCPQLRSCKLVVNVSPDPLEHPLVELPCLHTLHMDSISVSSSVLDKLSFPKLHTLVFRGDNKRLPAFVSSCSRLASLTVEATSFDTSAVEETLRALPSTTRHVSLHEYDYNMHHRALDDRVLEILAQTPPELESLDIGINSTVSDMAIEQFVIKRMAMGETPSLKHLRVLLGRPMKLDIKTNLKQYTERGLELVLSYAEAQASDWSPWYGLQDAPSRWGPAWGFPIW
ncbi:hypothetical protein R3P38DRAFT_3049181, partial [Favolaschia claudopus]